MFASSIFPVFAEETVNPALAIESPLQEGSAPFTDVNGTIYEEAVKFLYDNLDIMGTDQIFGVEHPIKRADVAVIMHKYLALDGQSNVPKTNFKYVPARAAQAVAAPKYHGIVNGKSGLYFGAADNITRGEAAIILFRSFGEGRLGDASGNEASSKFTDVTGRYVEPVNLLVKNVALFSENQTRDLIQRRI
ncbi:S-layer homology domain-containing protein [Domibacillus sp. 8LH]|uniref:S-layer homology domain-containing protein n=1 Tax=Domibacillus sp. 8LH TaxID=3073900 RepID=UPI003175B05A